MTSPAVLLSLLILSLCSTSVASATTAAPAPALDDWALERVRDFRAREAALPLVSGHASSVHLVGEAAGRPVRTRTAVLVVHGLFNSPVALKPVADHFATKDFNVVNLRLPGHYEVDPRAIKSTVRWTEWLDAVRDAFELTKALGDEVVLAGHSTGALALTWVAVENPARVRGLALFAPAFKVHLLSAMSSSLMNALRMSHRTASGRILNGHAALQVRDMTRAFRDMLDDGVVKGEESREFLAQRLADVPVWMANISVDTVIDVGVANAVFEAIELWGRADRGKYVVPKCEFLLHDYLPGSRNPNLPTLLRSMDETIR